MGYGKGQLGPNSCIEEEEEEEYMQAVIQKKYSYATHVENESYAKPRSFC